jgi:ABC-type multidrug transport system fused ATPase/permease subunit
MTTSPDPTPARSAPATLQVRADLAAASGAHRASSLSAREQLAESRRGERTIGGLFSDASRDLSAVVRNEAAGAVGFAIAGVFGFLALIMLLFAAAYGLFALGLSRWLSFLIVAVVLLILAGILALIGKSRMGKVGKPERTQRTLKHVVDTLKRAKPHPR